MTIVPLFNNILKVVKVADLGDIMQGIVFERLILNRYGTFDFNKNNSYLNVRVNLTDDEEFEIVTL